MVPWYHVWDGLKNKTCRYLLHRYLGQFLEVKLNLEQLNVELYNGKATVKDVALNCKALNELCEEQGWGVEVTGGHIGLIEVTVPWNAIMTKDSSIEVTDLFISLRPVQRQTDGSSMLESVWSSVSSSMQLAQDCLEKNAAGEDEFNAQNNSIEGLEKFAQTIDSVLNRIKAKCINSEIRLEYLPPNSSQGTAIIIKINSLSYKNEAGSESASEGRSSSTYPDQFRDDVDSGDGAQRVQTLSTFATHNISMEGITIYTEEFKVSQPSSAVREQPLAESTIHTRRSMDLDASIDDPFYSMMSTGESLKRAQESMAASHSSATSSIYSRSRSRTPTACEDSDPEDEASEPTIEIFNSKCIPIVRVDGKQEIIIKMKQTEDVSGPKVSLDIQIGSFYAFVTPRQLHLVTNFCDAFLVDTSSNEGPTAGRTDPSMGQSVGSASTKNFSSNMTGILGDQGNWGEPLDECTFRGPSCSTRRASSTYSMDDGRSTFGSGYCESVNSSLSSSTTTTCSSKFARKPVNLEASADISNFNISMASATVVVLHEDILLACSAPEMQGSPLSEESEVNMLSVANYFFSCVKENTGLVGFECHKNHLKFYAAPIMADGTQHRNKAVVEMKFTVSLTRVDLHEVLEGVAMPLLEFERKEVVSTDDFHKRPEMIIHMKSKTVSNPLGRRRKVPIPPRTEFEFNLDKCKIEMDISIYDRLSAIFCTSPFSEPTDLPLKEEIKKNESRHLDPIKEFNITSAIMQLNLRFPIADNRPIHDPNRVPWWKQNVRPDLLLFAFYQFRMKITPLLFEIVANEINVYYVESPTIPRIHLLKSNLVNNSVPNLNQPSVDYPKIKIELPTEKTLAALIKCCTEDSDSGETSGEGCALYSRRNRDYVPFSAKRVCRQSDTPHPSVNAEESETILLPGDAQEMRKFCDIAMKTSKLQIKISLPTAVFQVISKQLYEIIYNRINTDLLMWEPSSPSCSRKSKPPPAPTIEQSLLNIGMMDSLYVPSTSPVHPYDSDDARYPKCGSSSEGGEGESGRSDDDDTESIYYSTYEKKGSKRSYQKPPLSTSVCSFELTVGKGTLSLFPPVRDAENRVLPNQLGEFTAMVESFCVFSVSGFNGNDNMAYLCVYSKDVKLFHCGLIPTRSTDPKLPDLSGILPSHMQSTLYPTPPDLTKGNGEGCPKREMLSLAIELKKLPDQYLKRLKITAGIQKATLRHNPQHSQHSWLNQLIDFLDVLDYPIEGYKPFGIVTEMQLHLWDCAIDYRPKNFQFRTVIEIGSFMTSSNIVSSVPGCTLRFIAEECVLSLAPYDPKNSKSENKITVLPSANLVPVLDLGLLDISLRLKDRTCERSPKFDLRTSIQDVHIHSCFDSGRALSQLITYVACDGDLLNVGEDGESMSSSLSSSIYSDAGLLLMKDRKMSVPEISARQQERVTLLMAEAVQETVKKRIILQDDLDEQKFERGVEVYFFPDESHQVVEKETIEEVKRQLSRSSSENSNDQGKAPSNKSSKEQENEPFWDPTREQQTSERSRESKPGLSRTNSSSDDWAYHARRGSGSSNELQELLNFETSVMRNSYMNQKDDDAVEALPQVREELGDIKQAEKPSPARKSSVVLEDDFYVIPDEEKTFLEQCGIKNLIISEDPLRMVDNHFKLPAGKPDLLAAPENFPMPENRYTLVEMSLTWHLYGGNDFPIPSASSSTEAKDKENIRPEPEPPMSDAFKHGVSYTKGTQNINTGKKPKEKLSWKTTGGHERNHELLVEIQLSKVRCSHEVYPRHTHQASRQVLIISELEVRDRLQTSDINKFLYHPSAKHLPNKSSQHMIVIKALHVRPNPRVSITEECSLRISLLPLRLNIDQHTLLFLAEFFNELSASAIGVTGEGAAGYRRQSFCQAPVMMVDDLPEAVQNLQARRMVSTNLDLLTGGDEKSQKKDQEASSASYPESGYEKPPIFFREVIFSPEVNIRLDYQGRRIEMSRGPVAGLLMGLGQLQCTEIKLKKIIHRRGILGIDKLIHHLCNEWLQDIKKNQLPGILGGVGPAFVIRQLFKGIYDLFRLPFEQYQKDGRFVRGLQLGAQSFTARTALAALEITSRLIQLLQFTAETAYDMVSPGPSVRSVRQNRKGKRKRLHRPQDIREGVINAYQIVKDGINDSANTLIETAVNEHDQKGYTGALGGIMRQIPPLVVQPAVLATQATTNILGGFKSSLVPDAKLEAREKWKEDSD